MLRTLLIIALSAAIVLAAGDVTAGETQYRQAGIVTSESGSLAMIETPDGEQWLVRTGELAGEAQVLDIAADSVLLDFGGRNERLRLAGSKAEPVVLSDRGIFANELRRMIEATPDLVDTADLPGLYDMQFLSEDTRAVAINGMLIENSGQAITAIRKALRARKEIRILLAEGNAIPVVYLNWSDSYEVAAED